MKLINFLAIILALTLTAATCDSSTTPASPADVPDKECKEVAKADCMCTMQFDPVCGCNKKTYGNACEAECHGIKTYTKGECPK